MEDPGPTRVSNIPVSPLVLGKSGEVLLAIFTNFPRHSNDRLSRGEGQLSFRMTCKISSNNAIIPEIRATRMADFVLHLKDLVDVGFLEAAFPSSPTTER